MQRGLLTVATPEDIWINALPDSAMCGADDEGRCPLEMDECPLGHEKCVPEECYFYSE